MLFEPVSGGVGADVGDESEEGDTPVGWITGVGTTVELALGGGVLMYESTKISSWAPSLKLYRSV